MAATANDASSIVVDYRSGRSVPMYLLHTILRPIRSQLLKFGDPLLDESPEIKIPNKVKQDCDVHERRVNALRVYDLSGRGPSRDSSKKKRVLYFAGGGWQMPASSQHVFLCAKLATVLPNTTVSLISYPLAPEYPAPKSFPKLCELYTTLLDESASAGETVIIAGDSAGGNIALCLPIYMLNQNPTTARAPAAIMALSPSTDLRRQHAVMKAVAKHDPLLTVPFIKSTADNYRGAWDAFDPRISPMAADLEILAKRGISVNGVTGTYDILSLDAVTFRRKLGEAGVKGRWLEWDRQMHVWVLTEHYGLRDARDCLDWIAEVLKGV